MYAGDPKQGAPGAYAGNTNNIRMVGQEGISSQQDPHF